MTRLTTVATCLLPLVLASCAMGLKHNEIVDGAILPYVVKGSGDVTVVFEAGLGDGLDSWKPVFEDVAGFSKAVAYSRAGYTGKAPADRGGTRTADDVVKKTKRLLEKADIEGPYVLVGHSIGGIYVSRFAELYSEDVAGIVLVDGRPKHFTSECKAAGLSPCAPPAAIALVAPRHVAAEIRGIEESEEQMPDPDELGQIPVTVIVATEPPPGAPKGAQEIWLRVQKEFADALENGRYVVAKGSGHYIHRDAPELVTEEIRSIVQERSAP